MSDKRRYRSKNHSKLKTAGVAVGILLVLFVLCMAISLLGSVAMIRGTEPYNYSIDLALNNAEVQQALGEPITVGWFAQGGVNVATGGDAELNIPLTGAYGNATIHINATKRPDSWKYWTIRVDTDSGQHIDLLEP